MGWRSGDLTDGEGTYDDAGRVSERTTNDGTTTYTYDANGNLLSAEDATGTISATYDRLDRPLTVSSSADQDATTSYCGRWRPIRVAAGYSSRSAPLS
jgi:YD repeat-containing protein